MAFPDYLRRQWPELTAARPQLLEVAAVFGEWWGNGKTGDVLNVSMPTRFGKSLTATAFSVWTYLQSPKTRILRASYAADLAESLGVQVRTQYERFFESMTGHSPAIVGTRSRWRFQGLDQDNHAACGINGGITGFGFDLAIVDDTAKNMLDAISPSYNKQLTTFKESVLVGRLEGKKKILNVGTRWTVNDWFSMWPDAEEYVLPAMTEDGRSICEAWKTTEELERERGRVSEGVWNAQYQQRPTERGKVIIFEGYTPETLTTIPDGNRYLIIDPATNHGIDFFVVGDYVYHRGHLTLVDMFAKQAAQRSEVADWINRREYAAAFMETNGVGADILEKLRERHGVRGLVGFVTSSDKYSRATTQSEDIKNYFSIYEGCNRDAVSELLTEFDTFPVSGDNIHDDLLDNVVMAFENLLRV